MNLLYPLNIATSLASTVLRAGVGVTARPGAQQPAELLRLYEFEGCPHCRLVREVLTELDLDALILPCPKGGTRYREEVLEKGGKAQFPYFEDPNTGQAMYESADIIAYLFATYGDGKTSWHWRLVELQRLRSVLTSVTRFGAGTWARPSKRPDEPLELYSFEASPFARPVRDLLCELEIPYVLRSVGRTQLADWVPPALRRAAARQAAPRTRNRQALQARAGVISVPYLVDPNTGREMAESAAILDYLRETYGA